MNHTYETAGNLLRQISEESRGAALTSEQTHIFNAAFYKSMLEDLIVTNQTVAKHFEERLDLVRKYNKL
jgi:hypothetical protein